MNQISCNIEGLREFEQRLREAADHSLEEFFESCAKELAARLLAKVIRRTPVGVAPEGISDEIKTEHWSGYVGGTLRRGWTARSEEDARNGVQKNAKAYVNSLDVRKQGKVYTIEVKNPVDYASYVEYGHRQTPGRFAPSLGKRLKSGWVEGKHMLQISEEELNTQMPSVIEKKIRRYMQEVFNGR